MAIVSCRADELPPFSAEDEARLRALAEAPDDEIDFSDIPPLTEEDFRRAMNVQVFEAHRAAKRKAAVHA